MIFLEKIRRFSTFKKGIVWRVHPWTCPKNHWTLIWDDQDWSQVGFDGPGGLFQGQEFWDSTKKIPFFKRLPQSVLVSWRLALNPYSTCEALVPKRDRAGKKRSWNPTEWPKSRRKITKGSESSLESWIEAAEMKREIPGGGDPWDPSPTRELWIHRDRGCWSRSGVMGSVCSTEAWGPFKPVPGASKPAPGTSKAAPESSNQFQVL